VKGARIHYPVPIHFLGQQRQTAVAFPKHSALARAVHKDERLLPGSPPSDREMRLYATPCEFLAMERAAWSSPTLPT